MYLYAKRSVDYRLPDIPLHIHHLRVNQPVFDKKELVVFVVFYVMAIALIVLVFEAVKPIFPALLYSDPILQ